MNWKQSWPNGGTIPQFSQVVKLEVLIKEDRLPKEINLLEEVTKPFHLKISTNNITVKGMY